MHRACQRIVRIKGVSDRCVKAASGPFGLLWPTALLFPGCPGHERPVETGGCKNVAPRGNKETRSTA